MDSFFAELGRTVLERWRDTNFSQAAFPEIATAVLEERRPSENVYLTNLMREFLLVEEQPMQTPSGFGQPELVVYDHPRFYIQALFWLEGTTDIHQHQFSGAFHVMAGSSLHSRFEFEDAAPVSAHLKVGNLRMKETRLLETGTTVPIVSGPGYIHSLFHLDTPSVTIVIRTHNDPGTSPQFTYLPPHIAVDPLLDDALTTRRKQLLDVLEKTNDESYTELVLEMVEALDFERGFFILQNGIGHLRGLGTWEEVLAAFARKHGELARHVEPTLDEIVRRDGLAAMRSGIVDVQHRFFLALLLNIPSRADILEMVQRRVPGEAVETILRWAEELCEMAEFSTWLLDAEFPEDVEVPLEEQPAAFLEVLRSLLAEKKAKGVSKEDAGKVKEALLGSSWRVLLE